MSKIRLGEPIFRSVQGEGNRTGVLSVWVRFFGCNLKCEGFYQPDPTDQSTWSVPEVLNNGKIYNNLSDVPIISTGCDSGYSWHPSFKHLAIDYSSATDLYADMQKFLYDGRWQHPVTGNKIDLCFTGGEPMMNQGAMVDIMKECKVDTWRATGVYSAPGVDYPGVVQIETNGTKSLSEPFKDFFVQNALLLHWNVSPKLFSVSGEKDAVDYEVISSYFDLSTQGCIKFVVNDTDACWNELAMHTKELRHIRAPVYVMPVGATKEQQTDTKVLSRIANRAINEGYHVSGRLQSVLFGNGVGT